METDFKVHFISLNVYISNENLFRLAQTKWWLYMNAATEGYLTKSLHLCLGKTMLCRQSINVSSPESFAKEERKGEKTLYSKVNWVISLVSISPNAEWHGRTEHPPTTVTEWQTGAAWLVKRGPPLGEMGGRLGGRPALVPGLWLVICPLVPCCVVGARPSHGIHRCPSPS